MRQAGRDMMPASTLPRTSGTAHLQPLPRRLQVPLTRPRASRRRSGAAFLGALGVTALVINVAGQEPVPVPPLFGPQPSITCPVDAVRLAPGTNVQRVVDSYPGRTTFCFEAGVHAISGAITPKTGDTLIGEFGAILDGTGWTTTDTTQAAIRAHNADVDNVTIRNLVIRNMPQKGIHAFKDFSDRWLIEYNEIASSHTGIQFPNSSMIRNNYIHHNVGSDPLSITAAQRGGGYVGYYATDTTFDTNEIAYNGMEQKVMDSVNVTFRNNFVHHNVGDGIWYDESNANALVEGNRVEDNGRNGIFYEAGLGSIIRNNTVRRSADTGIFISTSMNGQIRQNILEDNFRGITYFINCGALSEGRGRDLTNNTAQDNTIRVGTQSGAFANGFSYTGDCTASQIAEYRDGSKNLTFSRNIYHVPSPTGSYWLWDGLKGWSQWQAFEHDLDGVVAP